MTGGWKLRGGSFQLILRTSEDFFQPSYKNIELTALGNRQWVTIAKDGGKTR